MKYALAIAEASLETKSQALLSYARSIQKAHPETLGIEALNPGAHVCNLERGLSGLVLLLDEAKAQNIRVRVLFFDREPSWVTS